VPPGRGLRRANFFWLRLTTASAQCLRLLRAHFSLNVCRCRLSKNIKIRPCLLSKLQLTNVNCSFDNKHGRIFSYVIKNNIIFYIAQTPTVRPRAHYMVIIVCQSWRLSIDSQCIGTGFMPNADCSGFLELEVVLLFIAPATELNNKLSCRRQTARHSCANAMAWLTS